MRFIAFGEKWRSDNIQWESKLSREIWRKKFLRYRSWSIFVIELGDFWDKFGWKSVRFGQKIGRKSVVASKYNQNIALLLTKSKFLAFNINNC